MLEDRDYTHIYVPAGCCGTLKDSLAASSRYDVIYEAGGVLIVVPAGEAGDN
ncbi:MAG: hypothetical protein U5Q44_15360 [Dehalococcoidia bacterium]|nr:hypothetical protein [Dehalococcoidia bacterium]